jgi:hypothetical protein
MNSDCADKVYLQKTKVSKKKMLRMEAHVNSSFKEKI